MLVLLSSPQWINSDGPVWSAPLHQTLCRGESAVATASNTYCGGAAYRTQLVLMVLRLSTALVSILRSEGLDGAYMRTLPSFVLGAAAEH